MRSEEVKNNMTPIICDMCKQSNEPAYHGKFTLCSSCLKKYERFIWLKQQVYKMIKDKDIKNILNRK